MLQYIKMIYYRFLIGRVWKIYTFKKILSFLSQ